MSVVSSYPSTDAITTPPRKGSSVSQRPPCPSPENAEPLDLSPGNDGLSDCSFSASSKEDHLSPVMLPDAFSEEDLSPFRPEDDDKEGHQAAESISDSFGAPAVTTTKMSPVKPRARFTFSFCSGRPKTPPSWTKDELDNMIIPDTTDCPIPITKAIRRKMLCMMVVEAAKYQRRFFDENGSPVSVLRNIERDRQISVATKASILGVSQRRLPTRAPSFMLLQAQPLKDLVNDVHILLAPTMQKDLSLSAMQQLSRLGLFQPSTFVSPRKS